ncbi:hypothetical protein VPNG_04189 [Cytospora leucostoma]|uniref:Large-conductance mechanosensitive channel n=1 Tax=Cytospora leucostoma TaxID=1230097 RepID=A0A423XDN8_9PEZI|nr:hypothetical protein VPNG_04189 [Cytospora leucostoma]
MPRLGEEGLDESLFEYGTRRTRRLVDGFVEFATEGNVLEIAFGLIVAAAFTNVVTSFVSDVILPPLSVLLPLNANLENKFAVLQPGPHHEAWGGYNTVDQAQEDGAIIMAYGVFLDKTINFVGLGLALYALAGAYQYLSRDPIIKHSVKCRYCKRKTLEEAVRCVNCTSWLDGREDVAQPPPLI